MKIKNIMVVAATALPMGLAAATVTDYVNPFIGTGALDNSLSGNNFPGATAPFGLVQACPDTHPAPDWYNASGYNYKDSEIFGFTHTRLSGTGASDLIDISLFPTVSSATKSKFSHDRESAAPGYYSVMLDDENVLAEITVSDHAAFHRYTFPAQADSLNLWIDLERSANKDSWGRRIINSQIRQVSPRIVEGYRVITGWAKMRKVYFSIEFEKPVKVVYMADGGRVYTNGTAPSVINGTALRAKVTQLEGAPVMNCKVGISAVSQANARLNRETEMPDFDFAAVRSAVAKRWDDMLGMISLEGDENAKKTFYTAMYHAIGQPNVISDVNGEYLTADYSTASLPEGEKHYTTFSLWDTYRAAHPLYTILFPEQTRDFVNSMLRHYDSYGYLPIWHLWGNDNYCMIGNHAIPVVVDAVLKGIPGIDEKKAWQAVKASSTDSHPNSPFHLWESLGYMPEDQQSQSVSITMEMAFDDWCAARLAEKVGDSAGKQQFDSRAANYRNLYDPSTGFFRARNTEGDFIEPFDPLRHGANGGNPYTEGNAWHYVWYVPQNVPDLIALMGGEKKFCERLDTFFTLDSTSGERNDNVSGLIGQYAHGNEPSHHVAYLYALAGKPQKTADLVGRIMTELYDNTSTGYSGNDDCGEMSSWYIFSALGFYPVNPASGEYVLGIPMFDRATVNLPNGNKFTVVANRKKAGATKIKAVKLNGKKLSSPVIHHSDIMAGSTLEFELI